MEIKNQPQVIVNKEDDGKKIFEIGPDGALRTYNDEGELALEIKPNQQICHIR